jgi:hypothetical protein
MWDWGATRRIGNCWMAESPRPGYIPLFVQAAFAVQGNPTIKLAEPEWPYVP